MVTGIVAAVISLVPILGFVSFVLGPLAMVLGIVGIAKRLRSRGFSVTALVTGTFGLLVSILYAVLFSATLSRPSTTPNALNSLPRAPGNTRFPWTTTSDSPVTSNQRGTDMRRPWMLPRSLAASPPRTWATTRNVSCRIYDSAGNLLVDDAASGAKAVAVCDAQRRLGAQGRGPRIPRRGQRAPGSMTWSADAPVPGGQPMILRTDSSSTG